MNKIEVNYDGVARDPKVELFEQIEKNIPTAIENVIEEKVTSQISSEFENIYRRNYNEAFAIEIGLKEREKRDKIALRTGINSFIFVLFFFVIGLFFLSIYLKNKKIIKEYKQFVEANFERKQRAIKINSNIITRSFSKISPLELRDGALKELKITKTNNIDYREIQPVIKNDKSFASLYSVNKYDIRNSYFYDLLYSTLEWRNVVTSASIRVREKDSNGNVYTRTLTAYHTEKTPFIELKRSTVIPTNYLPKLSFSETMDKFKSEKEYDKMVKKGQDLLENKDFYKFYSHIYNNKVDYFTYFQGITQDKYIDIYKYFLLRLTNPPYVNKINNSLYSTEYYLGNSILFSNYNNWVNVFFNTKTLLKIEDIKNGLVKILTDHLMPIFKPIVLAYANKYIASENYEKLGDSYTSTYQDLNEVDNTKNTNIIYLLNRIIANGVFSLTSKNPEKRAIFKVGQNKKMSLFGEQDIQMKSYYGEDLIDTVYVDGYAIHVPFRRFYEFEETKKTIYTLNYKLSTPGAKIAANNTKTLIYDIAISEDENGKINDLKFNNKISFNKLATENQEELKDALILIDWIFTKFSFLKNKAIIEIDDTGLAIYINEVNKQNENALEMLEREVKKLFSIE
ncbi:hypothetical protein AB5V95_00055 [Metamycoplasma spumans]|uniref:hypothetical protein n=1 Tax=Metamycoplasma spumans TaxID=92406 RepID=UPI0034DD4409